MLFYLAEWEEEEPGEDLVSEIDEEEKDEADEDEGDVCYLKKLILGMGCTSWIPF